jgi:hypothetical protein
VTDTIDQFVEKIADSRLRFALQNPLPRPRSPERVDALFHLPLLALAIMVIAQREKLISASVGRRVAALFTEHFGGLRTAGHTLEWSSTLRRRSAEALTFLEVAAFVGISSSERREIVLTQAGRSLLNRAMQENLTDTGALVRGLVRAAERSIARRGRENA